MNEDLAFIINLVSRMAPRGQSVNAATLIFVDLDLDSLQFIELFTELEKKFDVRLLSVMNDLRIVETPEKLLAFITKMKESE